MSMPSVHVNSPSQDDIVPSSEILLEISDWKRRSAATIELQENCEIGVLGHRSKARRLAPFGRDVLQLVSQGKSPNVYIFTGNFGWQRARKRLAVHGRASAMVLPVNDDPAIYRWPSIPTGALLDARSIDRQMALQIATVIVSAGTPMIFVLRKMDGFTVSVPCWRNPLSAAIQVGA